MLLLIPEPGLTSADGENGKAGRQIEGSASRLVFRKSLQLFRPSVYLISFTQRIEVALLGCEMVT